MKWPRSNWLKPDQCPNCGYRLDAATAIGPRAKPTSGDVTICTECRSILVFGDNMRLRWPTDAEMVGIAGDRRIVMAMRALAEMPRRERKSTGTPL